MNTFMDIRATIVCEGVNDAEIISQLAAREKISGIHAEHMKGDSGRLSSTLETIAGRKTFGALPALAVVLDANGDPAATLSTANDALRKIVPLGERPLEPEKVREVDWNGRAFRVGVFIMPGGGQNGGLEELVLPSARSDHMECVQPFRQCAREAAKDSPVEKESKKTVQALLSAMPKHCVNLADAAEKGMIDFNHSVFDGLKKFIRDLSP